MNSPPQGGRLRGSSPRVLLAGVAALAVGVACGQYKDTRDAPGESETPLPVPPISDDTWTPDSGVLPPFFPFGPPELNAPPDAPQAPAGQDPGGDTPTTEQPAPEQPASEQAEPEAPAPDEPTPPEPLAQLPECSTGVMASFTLSALSPPSEGSNRYRVPSESRMISLRSSFTAFLQNDVAGALRAATSAEYLLCRGTGTESSLVMWRPAPGEGQAIVVLRMGLARSAIFEAPHILYDSGTLAESVTLFQRLGARALIAAAAHRCASSEASSCSGTTGACGSTAPYRVSDVAHTERSLFHVAHVALSEHFSSDWVLQIHGMSRSGVSVSDGTSQSTTPESPSARIATALSKAFSGVTTCNSYSGGVPYASHLCGTTNTQGRHVNGSSNACSTASKTSSLRFIHLEQGRSVRDQAEKVAQVMDSVLP